MKAYTLKFLAELTDSALLGDPNATVTGVAGLERALSNEASFLANKRYLPLLEKTAAGAVFVFPDTPRASSDKNYLLSPHPSRAFQQFVDFLFPPVKSGFTGIHPTACLHESVRVGSGVTIGPYAVLDEGVVIGDESIIGAGSILAPFAQVGKNCLIHPRVVIRERCLIGDRVVIQPGAVIGSCGFGFTSEEGHHEKLHQVGIVVIENDVEIGANTTIDRARFETTLIRQGSKIDNLVQIGHGVRVGKNNLIVAQTGIAGSTETGNQVILAGQVAVAGHLKIADSVIIAGKSGVSKSIPEAGKYGGIPVQPISQYNRSAVYLRRVEELFSRLEALEKAHKP